MNIFFCIYRQQAALSSYLFTSVSHMLSKERSCCTTSKYCWSPPPSSLAWRQTSLEFLAGDLLPVWRHNGAPSARPYEPSQPASLAPLAHRNHQSLRDHPLQQHKYTHTHWCTGWQPSNKFSTSLEYLVDTYGLMHKALKVSHISTACAANYLSVWQWWATTMWACCS